MGDFQEIVLKRLDDLEKTVEQLKSENSKANRAIEFERLPAGSIVGKDYVAYRFGTSEESVLRGRAGTHLLKSKRISERPLQWIKRDVDAIFSEYTKSIPEKAAEESVNAKPVKRRKSIITRQPTT
jgi:hypothetical protein